MKTRVNPRVGTVRYRDADGNMTGFYKPVGRSSSDTAALETRALDKLYGMFLSENTALAEYLKEMENDE